MSFRTRAFLVLLAAVLVPLAVLAVGVRRELSAVVARERAEQIEGAERSLGAGLEGASGRIGGRLARIAIELAEDSRFRLAVERSDPEARVWLLDYAAQAMRAADLDILQVQDAGGTILSSGHFRNEYDRAGLPAAATFAAEPGFVLRARTADGNVVALSRVHPFRVGGAEIDCGTESHQRPVRVDRRMPVVAAVERRVQPLRLPLLAGRGEQLLSASTNHRPRFGW